MKSLFRLPNLLLLAIAIFAFSSCTEDPVFNIGPNVDLLDEVGFLANDATLTPNTPIRVKLTAAKGDNPMTSVEMQEDGVRIADATRITIDGVAASSAAPLLFDAEKDALTWEIEITPHETGSVDYTFVVADDGGEVSSTSINITIEAPSDPPVLTAPNGVLALQAEAGALTSISLMGATPSGALLSTLTILEGGVEATGGDRFWFGSIMGVDEFNGSVAIATDDQAGFTKDLFIRANATDGSVDSYDIVLTDEAGLADTLSITVTSSTPGTPLTKDITGILLNASGPPGTGGLDLDDGLGGGSTDAGMEIRDQGNISSGSQDWQQKISGTNSASMRFLSPTANPDYVFESVASKEAVLSTWSSASPITVSETVQVGDVFAVYEPNQDRYYAIKVTNITLTTTDNADSYTFSIKY